jgi:hypothetical protein
MACVTRALQSHLNSGKSCGQHKQKDPQLRRLASSRYQPPKNNRTKNDKQHDPQIAEWTRIGKQWRGCQVKNKLHPLQRLVKRINWQPNAVEIVALRLETLSDPVAAGE